MVSESPVLPRTSFNSSQLIRLLANLDIVGPAPSKQSFAEGLSKWLNWTDAISLSSALSSALDDGQGAKASEQQTETGPASCVGSVFDEYSRVRRELAQSIAADALWSPAPSGTTRQAPPTAGRSDNRTDFSPYLHSYQTHQRAMEARIAPLRARTRAALSAASTELGQIAALDAVLEQALSARERHLLSTVPVLLRSYFERSRKAEQGTSAEPHEANAATPPEQPALWMAAFGRQVQSVLLAELEVRLHPVEGMIEALRTAADAKAGTLTKTKTQAAALAAKEATRRP